MNLIRLSPILRLRLQQIMTVGIVSTGRKFLLLHDTDG